ncbi:MAG: hypothetical protein ACOCXP_04490, partial [Candidatus Dojkabacteria bacterium]
LVISTILILDIYSSVTDAAASYRVLTREQERLVTAANDQEELNEQLQYYSSLEYQQQYAYDSLNLAHEGEQLFVVETEDRTIVQELEEEIDPILRDRHDLWWELVWELAKP